MGKRSLLNRLIGKMLPQEMLLVCNHFPLEYKGVEIVAALQEKYMKY